MESSDWKRLRLLSYALVVALAVVGLSACTRANTEFANGVGPEGASTGDASQNTTGGGGGSGDFSVASSTVFDASPACVNGARACIAAPNASTICENGNVVIDRDCPATMCMNGYCMPPSAVVGTTLGERCDTDGGPLEQFCHPLSFGEPSCQPFTGNGTVEWLCANPPGTGGPGTSCTLGMQCRSSVCIASTSTCFVGCHDDNDCPTPNSGKTYHCRTVDIVSEGNPLSAASCVPNP